MQKLMLYLVCLAAFWTVRAGAGAPHSRTVVKEYDRVFTTYPYSDPDPVPAMTRFYPYFRYDGYTDQPVQKKWKVVELSNDYVQLLILPEIGGKIWAAIEKSTGKPFIYFNQVVKFRDVSMRGPWTSGGMEANYGIMGHTPNCFSPVDYLVRRNPDGSASCFIGVLDLLTRSSWRLEIRLPADQACFTTRSFWHNGSGAEQPYYSWMNVGLKAAGNLQFINPGTQYLGHDGRAFDWPLNPENGRDISWYDRNDFGPYKSYHVFGRFAEFAGGYWHNEDFGMARYSPYEDKPGRKVWIWGLSRQGMIWEDLLTDTDGQYVEVQSGRLFNQNDEQSAQTPFKHREFPPYGTDTWTEYWQPVKGTKGFVSASPWGALNVSREADRLVIRLSPARALRDQLEVFDGNRRLWAREVVLKPMQPVEAVVPLAGAPKALRVCLGGDKLQYVAGDEDVLSRPTTGPVNFDWHSAYGLYLKGKESARQRAYPEATEALQACLKLESNLVPALVEMAELANRRADYAQARDFARRALGIDTYDPAANYQFGRASAALGRQADTKEAFSIAGLAMGWRSAAGTELAKEYLREKHLERALACAEESLETNRRNLDALQVRACIYRLQGDAAGAEAAVNRLLDLDPLNHFAHCERFLRGQGKREDFTGLIRNELPHETFLELAAWYRNVGLEQDAAKVLELAPPTAEVLYWLAFLRQDTNLLARAEAVSPAFVFPFRPESIPVFEWAGQQGRAWQPRYYLALIRWHQGEQAAARELLAACGDAPRFGPFYATRAQLAEDLAVRDLQRAGQLDPGQWRYGMRLAKHYLKQADAAAALTVAADYTGRFPTNSVLALLYAKALVGNGRYQAAAALLGAVKVLPCEGSTDAHGTYREAHLMLAVQGLKAGAVAAAQQHIETARQWPEWLGAGKPYAEETDERLEDWLAYQCYQACQAPAQAKQALDRILARPTRGGGVGEILRALALQASSRGSEAEQLLSAWLKQDPASKMARWGADILAGRPAGNLANEQDASSRILAAWLQGTRR
ncbi:MAG TPA: DUF5107 domain-containing protein [Bacillota bacterium]|nr:DUF5107 domain-containing protein [Bacillota bacterium]